jgi:hypothetical protein
LHIERLGKLLPFCSSPKSLSSSWNLRSQVLTKDAANRLVNEGAQLLPVNEKERILKMDQQGVELGPNKRLILGLRHSQGNYYDILDNQGRFTYQPPNNTKGMMRYRWSELLQKELDVPLVIILIIWFEYRINDNLNHVFIIAPATITDFNDNINDLKQSLSYPLKLRIIERNDAYDYIRQLNALDQARINTKVRRALDDQLATEWSYSQINNFRKGNKIKEWAKTKGYFCPGEFCNHTKFEDLKNSEIAFGHIIPQNWASIFPHILNSIHHPDNLYLTCARCNSQLRDNFPKTKLQNIIITTYGTVGDWIRQFEKEIRSYDRI